MERLTKIEQLLEKLVGRSESNMTAVVKKEESDPHFSVRLSIIYVKLDANALFYSTMG